MTVYLNPNSSPRTFHFEQKFSDQEAYDAVKTVKMEVYDALVTLIEERNRPEEVALLVLLQARRSDIHAGKVDK